MTKPQLLHAISHAIATVEGFFLTESECKSRNLHFPTRAQVNSNPGNIRAWKSAQGIPYPITAGYVDFSQWAKERNLPAPTAEQEGWRVLQTLISQYISGKYHHGTPPTVLQFFRTYAPSSDSNDPDAYAKRVASILGVPISTRLIDLITEW